MQIQGNLRMVGKLNLSRECTNLTVLATNRAIVSLRKEEGTGMFYFSHIETFKPFRRKGYCTSLLYFVLGTSRAKIQMDIRYQSIVMKRIASSFGYVKKGMSRRFQFCELWEKVSVDHNLIPLHKIQVIGKKLWYRKNEETSQLLFVRFVSKRSN